MAAATSASDRAGNTPLLLSAMAHPVDAQTPLMGTTLSVSQYVGSFFHFLCHPCNSLLRLCVFQMSLYQNSLPESPVSTMLIDAYRYVNSRHAIKADRAMASIHIMERLGGIRRIIPTVDGGAQVEYLLLTQERVFQAIANHGGKLQRLFLESEEWIDIIALDPESPMRDAWPQFASEVIAKMGWEQRQEGFVFNRGKGPSPLVPTTKRCYLRCPSPAITYAFERKAYVGPHLTLGDVCLFDYRGTGHSAGTPSEGGCYCDSETVYQALTSAHGYTSSQIYATGFCSGAAVATHLAFSHQHEGINLIAESTATSIPALIAKESCVARWVGNQGLNSIQSKELAITSLVGQDYFNTLSKLQRMSMGLANQIILVGVERDPFLPPDSLQQLISVAQTKGRFTCVSIRDGLHDEKLLNQPAVWEAYTNALSRTHVAGLITSLR